MANNKVRAKPGRPSKLTPQIKDKLLKLISLGSPLESAAHSCGLDYSTLRAWIQRGKGTHPSRPPNPEYVAFVDDYNRALADGEVILLGYIHQAAKQKDWKAAAWLLSRRKPRVWGERKLSSMEDLAVLLAGHGLFPTEKIEEIANLSDSAIDELKKIINNVIKEEDIDK